MSKFVDLRPVKSGMIFALAMVTSSCAPLSAGKEYFAQAMPVCELISNQQKYVGQRVLVRGLYNSTPHGGLVYDLKCNGFLSLRGSIDGPDRDDKRAVRVIEAAFIRDELARVPVVVSGVFEPIERLQNGERILVLNCPCIEDVGFVAARQP